MWWEEEQADISAITYRMDLTKNGRLAWLAIPIVDLELATVADSVRDRFVPGKGPQPRGNVYNTFTLFHYSHAGTREYGS